MLKLIKTIVAAAAFSAVAAAAQAQDATIEDAAWLAGRWVGEGLGGQLEETWAPPAGGQMVGHFRLIRDGAPAFYEIMLMEVTDRGVRMRVKHFNPDFVGWEERDGWHAFEPVAANEDALEFEGLSIRRVGENDVEISLQIRYPDGVREERITMRRAPL
ncbi:MAG TPA: DUF6265 family protein [Vitreimonas sp.]|uniref:DUF6265 family protein n=1 Tax=Vitreimonas sp. TaxID=3069702 RepID=UPI002D5DC0C0|nr:DUF6265 family protein [Vitreimonas sp.]HYD89652.1 DUF6265 family protein [Vitreimonas sp.]